MNNKNLIKAVAIMTPLLFGLSAHAENRPDREAFKAALDACAQEQGITRPTPGTRPSDSDREKMETCLSAKGFTRPQGAGPGRHHHGPPPPQEDSQEGASAAR